MKTYLPPKFLVERDPERCIKCEVCIGGQRIELTFKEYELLRFLASHPGRV